MNNQKLLIGIRWPGGYPGTPINWIVRFDADPIVATDGGIDMEVTGSPDSPNQMIKLDLWRRPRDPIPIWSCEVISAHWQGRPELVWVESGA
jgi:hypothetical protein